MGIIRKGILGGFKNKVGSVIGSSFRNKDVIKSLPKVSSKPPTLSQTNQRLRFGLITGFLSRLSAIIDGRYKQSGSTSSMNEAVSYHLQNAVMGVAPNYTIDYTKLQFSSGSLENPETYSVAATATGKLDYSWSLDGVDDKYLDATDVINVLVYNPVKDRFVTVKAAAPRSVLAYSLQLPPNFIGDSVYCYFSFSSVKKSNFHSDSVHVSFIPVV